MDNVILNVIKEMNLNEHDAYMLVHDIDNLRGSEWEEDIKNKCSKSTYKKFKKLIG